MDHVFGYTIANDVSGRDWQKKRNGGQWLLGKTFDTFCPLGPIVDTGLDPSSLSIKLVWELPHDKHKLHNDEIGPGLMTT